MAATADARSSGTSTTAASSAFRDAASSAHLRHLLCGAAAGAAAKTVTAPLDRLKIIFQVSEQRFTLRAGAGALRHTLALHGARALWRGHSATLLRIVPYAGLHYASHEALEESLLKAHRSADGASTYAAAAGATRALGPVERFAAGAGAGALATVATYPLDVLRARLALAGADAAAAGAPAAAAPGLAAGVRALAAAGPRAAFRGLGPTLAGIVPYSGVTWLAYGTLRERADAGAGTSQLTTLAAGALAGLVGQSATYPLDIARRRMQVGGAAGAGGAAAVLARAVRAEGAAVLFKGLSLNWLKGPMATAVSFAAFDALSTRMRDAAAA
jgi:solute carrier family 25 protein 42